MIMKSAYLGVTLLLASGAWADVIELEDATARTVIDVYEEMREEEQELAGKNEWIHEFEKDSVGTEMDHLSRLKRTAENLEEM